MTASVRAASGRARSMTLVVQVALRTGFMPAVLRADG
jgi:hypothetical protein